VIDISADSLSNAPVILYADKENDITDSVIAELNRTAPSGRYEGRGEERREEGEDKK